MVKSLIRWAFILLVILAIGPLLGSFVRALRDFDGGGAFTLLVNQTPFVGIIDGLITIIVALAIAAVCARFFSLGTALACAGIIFAWAAWPLGTVDEIVRRAQSGRSLWIISIEGLLAALAAVGIAHIAELVAASAQPTTSPLDPSHPAPATSAQPRSSWLFSQRPEKADFPNAFIAILGGAVAAAIAVSLLSVTMLKGQVLFATSVGGIAAGWAASAICGRIGAIPRLTIPMLALALLALIGPIAASIIHGSGIIEAVYAGKLLPLARPIGIDWAAGALLGVPIGFSWSGLILDVRSIEHAHDTQAHSAHS